MKRLLLPLFLYSFLLGKCYGIGDPGFWSLLLTNDSDIEIACLVATDEIGFSYPDTLLPQKLRLLTSERVPQRRINYIAPMETEVVYYDSAYSWYHSLDINTQKGVLSIYIFSADSLRYYDWHTIRDKNCYITRYDLTAKDLYNNRDEDNRYVIHYPL